VVTKTRDDGEKGLVTYPHTGLIYGESKSSHKLLSFLSYVCVRAVDFSAL